MNRLGLMTLASLAIGLIMVIASFAANTEGSWEFSGSAGTGTPGIDNPSDEGMSSDQSGEYGLAPESRDEDFNTPSNEEMSPDRGSEFGMAPEFRGEDSNTRYGGEMSSGENRYHGSPYKVTSDKDPNSPY